MHAGDAIWYLHAELTMLERRHSTEPSTLELLAQMREALGVVGTFVQIEPPPADKMQQLIESISSTVMQTVGVPQYEDAPNAPPSESGKRSDFESPERIEAAKTILDEMINSGEFDWASMISDIYGKLMNGGKFISDKQFRAIVNIGRKGDDGMFWERLEDEHPEAVKVAEAAAANAN